LALFVTHTGLFLDALYICLIRDAFGLDKLSLFCSESCRLYDISSIDKADAKVVKRAMISAIFFKPNPHL
jgi:hypothetical protein